VKSTSAVGKSFQVVVPSVGTKATSVTVKVKDQSGKSFTLASAVKIAKNKPFSTPIVKFTKAGKFTMTISYGTVKRTVTVTVKK
jgi:hypothetical protein